MKKISVKEAISLVKSFPAEIACWENVGKCNWNIPISKVIPLLKRGEEFDIWSLGTEEDRTSYHKFRNKISFRDGVLKFVSYADERIRGNWGCLGGKVVERVEEYQVNR